MSYITLWLLWWIGNKDVLKQNDEKISPSEKFSPRDIKKDVAKIEKFHDKNSNDCQELNVTLQNLRKTKDNPNNKPSTEPEVLLAVGFFKGSNYTREKLEECTLDSKSKEHTIDYAFVISSDTKTWEIVELGSSGNFAKLTGSYSMPEHFAVEK